MVHVPCPNLLAEKCVDVNAIVFEKENHKDG
jgi:hypothetical protein